MNQPAGPTDQGPSSSASPDAPVEEQEGRANRSALLLGSDHTDLGAVVVESVGPYLAVGMSCGRFRKGYPHLDPNEDAVFAATDGVTTVLAVADGHNGFDASLAAIGAIAGASATSVNEVTASVARQLTIAAIKAIAAVVPELDPPRDTSSTALTIAVVRQDSLAAVTIGDTACFIATPRRARRIGTATGFVSPTTTPGTFVVEESRLRSKGVVAIATDGFLDFVDRPRQVLRSVSSLQAPDGVERLIEASLAGGAGDNVAVAIVRRS